MNSFNPWTYNVFPFFCVPSLISFNKVLYISFYRSFTSLVKFIPRYFTVFDNIVNKILSLNFSSISLLVYRNTINFCMLILHSPTLMNSLINSNKFLVVPLEFFEYKIVSFAKSQFYLFFSNLVAFYFFVLPNYSKQALQYYIE